jgi:hypothetical protein
LIAVYLKVTRHAPLTKDVIDFAKRGTVALEPNRQAQEHDAAAAGAGGRRTALERSFHLKLIGAIDGQYCTDTAQPQRLS